MAFSYQNYTGDNTTDTFAIPFTFTAQTEISVTVDGVAETGLTFPSAASVQLTSAPATGTLVQVRRTTDLTARSVDFASGSVLTEEDLDNSNIQTFHAAQEAVDKSNDGITLGADDKWDAQSKIIKNVGTPTASTDGATKAYVDNVAGSASAAAASASAAATSATNAATSATNAATSETNAATSASTATTQATNAATSATNAATSATTAATEATNSTNSSTASANSATASANSATAAASSATDAQSSEDEAEEWATKTNGIVASTGYSSKAWATGGTGVTSQSGAGAAQEWATKASNSTVDGTELSSKAYAVGDMNRGSAGAHSAKDWASYVSGLNTVDGTHKSARAYAIDAANAVADFNQVYYGTYANDTDAETAHTNAGNTVAAGDLYFSTSTNAVRYYDGTSWTDIAAVNTSNFATAGFSIAMSIAL